MILYFDTETSGLRPGRIIQLAYIMDYGDREVCKNFYFAVEYIEPSAQAVHGLSVEKLALLSNGKTFSDSADEIYDDFYSASLVVAHNFKFDLTFMIAEFSYLDRIFRYHESFDTMRFFTPIMKLKRTSSNAYKYPKLSELMDYAEVFPYDVSRYTMDNFPSMSSSLHDAVFDTTAMFLSVKHKKAQIPELSDVYNRYAYDQE